MSNGVVVDRESEIIWDQGRELGAVPAPVWPCRAIHHHPPAPDSQELPVLLMGTDHETWAGNWHYRKVITLLVTQKNNTKCIFVNISILLKVTCQ